ncbi:integrase core domain-containing protein, partial [Sediminibacterium sp.]
RIDYNTERPHKSLGYLSPLNYAEQYYRKINNLENSN